MMYSFEGVSNLCIVRRKWVGKMNCSIARRQIVRNLLSLRFLLIVVASFVLMVVQYWTSHHAGYRIARSAPTAAMQQFPAATCEYGKNPRWIVDPKRRVMVHRILAYGSMSPIGLTDMRQMRGDCYSTTVQSLMLLPSLSKN
jgi:hypothetical protein